jgi:hypothetical protein
MKFGNMALTIALLAFILSASYPSFGMNWTQINTNGFGDANNQLINGAYFNQKMYVATGKESDNGVPSTPIKVFEYDGSTWKQVNTDGFGDSNNMMGGIGMVVYQNLLCVGTKNEVTGAQIWTYDGTNWIKFYKATAAKYGPIMNRTGNLFPAPDSAIRTTMSVSA